ncbi:type I phosphomannose isomerase catalytic subunit [Paenibacillus oryzisoli]|uniref:type I phosphomannose isomerase catalytic subunit n=1 Tax=Paenibacillus oryzisoli TaxID=1850517 RepID=UPI003D2E2C82
MKAGDYQSLAQQPIRLERNRVWRTYSGGKLIDAFQGNERQEDGEMPEEWVASVVQATNVGREHVRNEGLSEVRLPDGSRVTLKEAIASDPCAYLGEAHVQQYGSHPAVLVKLLDAGERLTIQVHPDREYAMTKFQSRFGKTEAWYVIGGRELDGDAPYVLFGFKPGVTPEKWKALFDKQDIAGMLDALHRIPVREGDVFLVEGGVPHAIGSGCFLIEIQEPTDYTLRTERVTPRGNPVPDQACHQGLGFDAMLECFHYEAHTLEEIKARWHIAPDLVHETTGGSLTSLIKESDTDRFRMDRLTVVSDYTMEPSGTFAIAIVVEGTGVVRWASGELGVARGDTFFLPAALPALNWKCADGEPLQVILCYPPRS